VVVLLWRLGRCCVVCCYCCVVTGVAGCGVAMVALGGVVTCWLRLVEFWKCLFRLFLWWCGDCYGGGVVAFVAGGATCCLVLRCCGGVFNAIDGPNPPPHPHPPRVLTQPAAQQHSHSSNHSTGQSYLCTTSNTEARGWRCLCGFGVTVPFRFNNYKQVY